MWLVLLCWHCPIVRDHAGDAVAGAASDALALYREVLLRQPHRVLFRPFAFDTFGGLHEDADELLKNLQDFVARRLLLMMALSGIQPTRGWVSL